MAAPTVSTSSQRGLSIADAHLDNPRWLEVETVGAAMRDASPHTRQRGKPAAYTFQLRFLHGGLEHGCELNPRRIIVNVLCTCHATLLHFRTLLVLPHLFGLCT